MRPRNIRDQRPFTSLMFEAERKKRIQRTIFHSRVHLRGVKAFTCLSRSFNFRSCTRYTIFALWRRMTTFRWSVTRLSWSSNMSRTEFRIVFSEPRGSISKGGLVRDWLAATHWALFVAPMLRIDIDRLFATSQASYCINSWRVRIVSLTLIFVSNLTSSPRTGAIGLRPRDISLFSLVVITPSNR